jgi:predicted nucleic acid-binding protein
MIEFPGNRAFCDTSFFFASLYPKDVNYQRAGEILKQALDQKIFLWTTWDIISETVTLLLYRFNAKAAIRFLDEMKPLLHIAAYDDSVRGEAERIFRLLCRERRFRLRCNLVCGGQNDPQEYRLSQFRRGLQPPWPHGY